MSLLPQELCGIAVGAGEVVINRQTALGSVDILARHFAGAYPEAFVARADGGGGDDGEATSGTGALDGLEGGSMSAVEAVVRVVEDATVEEAVSGSAFLCLATLCAQLQARMLPFLSRLLPPMCVVLEAASGDATAWTDDRRLVVQSALASLVVTADVLPRFLSPFLSR